MLSSERPRRTSGPARTRVGTRFGRPDRNPLPPRVAEDAVFPYKAGAAQGRERKPECSQGQRGTGRRLRDAERARVAEYVEQPLR